MKCSMLVNCTKLWRKRERLSPPSNHSHKEYPRCLHLLCHLTRCLYHVKYSRLQQRKEMTAKRRHHGVVASLSSLFSVEMKNIRFHANNNLFFLITYKNYGCFPTFSVS